MKIQHNKSKNNNGIVLINYSNEKYTRAQKKNTSSALKIGGFKKVISFSHTDIDTDFMFKNKAILNQNKGGGYWLWKPYFIKKALLEIKEDEFLFYCDSGSVFLKSIDELVSSFDIRNDIMVFELQSIEKNWTKRDCFQLLACDLENYYETKQRLATFSLWKKTPFSMNLVEEWLTYAQDERNLTDIENEMGLPNYDGFKEHRHDQSIFSLLTKKYKIKAYRDPSQFGNNYKDLYPESKYPQLLKSTRQRNISAFEFIKKKLRPYLPNGLRKIYLSKVKKIVKM